MRISDWSSDVCSSDLKDRSATPIDFDALPAVDVDVHGFYFNEQISQEFQLLYEVYRLQGLLGFYYLDASADTLFDVRIFYTFTGLTAFTEADEIGRAACWDRMCQVCEASGVAGDLNKKKQHK